MTKAAYPAYIKISIQAATAAHNRLQTLRNQLSALRDAAGVSPLLPWLPPDDLREAVVQAENFALDADQITSRLIRLEDRK